MAPIFLFCRYLLDGIFVVSIRLHPLRLYSAPKVGQENVIPAHYRVRWNVSPKEGAVSRIVSISEYQISSFLPQTLHNGTLCLRMAAEDRDQAAERGEDGDRRQHRPEGEAVG